ncbi:MULTISPECIES: hypothetical protein [Janibacter]|uniref:hypothetical protein n=1 Tax=Janibacter TaxID=53457 RepID=UPI001CEF5A51|nr:hypothetical protein [Janibacter melonis]MCB5990420.1 hypothetical protein [Janibacter melonis]
MSDRVQVVDPGLADRVGRAVLGEGVDPERADDHLAIVGRAAQADEVTRDLLRQAVAAARAHGHSWAAIGGVLGLSRQAVQQRFGSETDPGGGAAEPGAGTTGQRRRLGPVTALDELAELEIAGRQGWRTVGAGMFYHLVERTDTQWEHRRVVWSRPAEHYARDGWQVGCRAFPWLYLVRDTGRPAERGGALGPDAG